MTPKIQYIKLFIKAAIILSVLSVFVVLGVFVRPNNTFENVHMKKWLTLNQEQKNSTIQHIIKDIDNQDLLIKCVDKIAKLPHSNEMMIRDAAVLCYNGIKLNPTTQDEK